MACGKYGAREREILSPEEVIGEFHYCLRNVTDWRVFEGLENIFSGKAYQDFVSLKALLKKAQYYENTQVLKPPYTSKAKLLKLLQSHMELHALHQFIRSAQVLDIHILHTESTNNHAESLVIYHNEALLMQEKRALSLEKIEGKWKITNIQKIEM